MCDTKTEPVRVGGSVGRAAVIADVVLGVETAIDWLLLLKYSNWYCRYKK